MGNGASTQGFPPAHVRIYQNLLQIQSPSTRLEMIQTLLQGGEYVDSARRAGLYSYLLMYVARIQKGQQPILLPGEDTVRTAAPPSAPPLHQYQMTQIAPPAKRDPYAQLTKTNGNEKAMSYFQSCLSVLGLEEEVALTEEALKQAYKKAALKAHPDKGGNQQQFEAVTRAFAYLTEILRRIQGGRAGPLKKVEAPSLLKTEREEDGEKWKHVQPIRLNPQKMDMNAFNQMFEQTRIPDPEDEGYGDWLKNEMGGGSGGGSGGGGSGGGGKTFSGKFNQDVFNKMFEEDARTQRTGTTALAVVSPQALLLAPNSGVELGREKPADFTAAANANLKYTDLKAAYTTESTFSGQVSDVHVAPRDLESYRASRKRAPDPLSNEEAAAVAAAEAAYADREKQRQLRAAHEGIAAQDYFERMKRLVIADGAPIGKTNRH